MTSKRNVLGIRWKDASYGVWMLVSLTLFALGVAGCAGDRDEETKPPRQNEGAAGSGAEDEWGDDTVVSDLSDDEAKRVCGKAPTWFGDEARLAVERRSCVVDGLLAAETDTSGDEPLAVCERTRDRCLEESVTEEPECDIEDEAARADCDVTVGELRACLGAYGDRTAEFFAGIDCDAALDPATLEEAFDRLTQDIELPEACQPFEDTCEALEIDRAKAIPHHPSRAPRNA